jgi:hypothetical protein
MAELGAVRQGKDFNLINLTALFSGAAWQGLARQGTAWLGEARRG